MNKIILFGNVGHDAELKQLQNTDVCSFSLATSEKWTDRAGERQKKTTWHRIVCFGKLAEISAKYVTKGMQVLVEGKIQTREFEKKDGTKGYSTEVIASNVQFSGAKPEAESTIDDQEEFPF